MTANSSDVVLVAAVREGDRAALAELYERYSADALRVARIISRDRDADELVAEAFVRLVDHIHGGGGPSTNVRAYLHTVIRNLHTDRVRRAQREHVASDMPWLLDRVDDPDDDLGGLDAERAATAFRSLPKNWQHLLWELEVQGRKPADIAQDMSVSAATVSSTAYRARRGLRHAYLDAHVPPASNPRCRWARDRLSQLVRGSLSARASAKACQHLDSCATCAHVLTELEQINTRLGVAIWPLVLFGSAGLFSTVVTAVPAAGGLSVSWSAGKALRSRSAVAAGSGSLVAAAVVAMALTFAGAPSGTETVALDGAVPQESSPAPEDGWSAPTSPGPAGPSAVSSLTAGSQTPPGAAIGADTVAVGDQTELPAEQPAEPVTPPEAAEPPPPEPVDLQLGAPTVTATGEADHWLLTVPVVAVEGAAAESFTVSLEISMNSAAVFIGRTSAGWDCGGIEAGDPNGDPYAFQDLACQYTYAPGEQVAPLELVLWTADPTGSLTLVGDGNDDPVASNDHRTF